MGLQPDFRARDTYSCRCLPGFEPTYLPAPLLSVGDGSGPAKPRLVYCNPVMTNGTKAEASAAGSGGSSSIYLNDNAANTNFTIHYFPGTVTYTESGPPMLNWDSRYLCHFSTEMAEIWSPGTSFQDVWTCKISALYLLYFHSYETFSENR